MLAYPSVGSHGDVIIARFNLSVKTIYGSPPLLCAHGGKGIGGPWRIRKKVREFPDLAQCRCPACGILSVYVPAALEGGVISF